MRWLVTYVITLLMAISIFAQEDYLILGKIIDKKDGQPISHANVWIKGTTIGSESNNEGYFLIHATDNADLTIIVSEIGYKKKEIKLSTAKDQWVDVELSEDLLLLDEIVVMPSTNPAVTLMKRVRDNRIKNDPDFFTDISNNTLTNNDLYLFNVNKKSLHRRILREVLNGTIRQEDSSLLIPLYHLDEEKKQWKDVDGNFNEEIYNQHENALEAVGTETFRNLLHEYSSEINFYKNNVNLFGKNFVSPLANFSNVYYKYYLIDSLSTDNGKQYKIKFLPKNLKDLVFKGEMLVDSATAAIISISAQMPSSSNINYVSDITIKQSFSPYNGNWVYTDNGCATTFQLRFNKNDPKRGVATMLSQHSIYGNYASANAKNTDENFHFSDSTISVNEKYSNAIDSLNNTKLQRVVSEAIDIFLHGYVHTWKFDIGPIVNFYKYNNLEGHRLSFGMRTGESMMKHVTIGGWFGYGFGNKEWRYGGEIQTQFGKNNYHKIGIRYSDNVEEYGSQSYQLYRNENHVGDVYNIFSSFKWNLEQKWHFGDDFARRKREEIFYKYEGKNITAIADLKHENIYANEGVQFIKGTDNYQRLEIISATLSSRIAFKQHYIDGYFHRYYLYNNLPIIYVLAEYGHYTLEGDGMIKQQGDYGKLVAFMRHDFPLLGGKFKYRVEVGHIIGNVPWTMLDITREGSGILISDSRFCFIQPMEFISDTWGYVGATYFTKGFLFNWIPGIKKLNLREVISLHCAMGGIVNRGHENVLDYPRQAFVNDELNNLKIPYIEASVGIANICRILAVESVWRCTHRENPNAVKWGVRLRFNVDF